MSENITIRELYDEEEREVVLQALEHRRNFLNARLPQLQIDAVTGRGGIWESIERLERKVQELDSIIDKWVDECH